MGRLLRAGTFRARALRRQGTAAESALWTLLRDRRVEGAKFRRQQPLGPFIVDFVCVAAALVIEADGAPHFPPPLRDIERDRWLGAAGYTVLRLPNHEILRHPELVLKRIRNALRALFPSPSGRGGGVRVNRQR